MIRADQPPPARSQHVLHAVHSVVALTAPLATGRDLLPAGSRGVVHDLKPDGSLYLVEFEQPFFCVAEVPGAVLRRG